LTGLLAALMQWPRCNALWQSRWRGPSFAAALSDKIVRPTAIFPALGETLMNEDVLNVSLRKFLKKVGITSQREIEQAIRTAIADGRLKGNEALPSKVLLTVDGIGLAVEIEGAIELE
jgi:hypothetical protein